MSTPEQKMDGGIPPYIVAVYNRGPGSRHGLTPSEIEQCMAMGNTDTNPVVNSATESLSIEALLGKVE